MKLSYLAFKNMVSKPLNLVLSLMLLWLSISLVTFVFQLSEQLSGQLDKNIAPFDMVVGAKGSPLQLVLSSVLHIDVPTGNIPLSEAKKLQKHPFVKIAIPVSYGDNHKGYRILGTEPGYLEQYNAKLASGSLFQKSFEVVVGSSVAQRLGMKLGDTFVGAHGLAEAGGELHDDHPYTVTGILQPTGTVIDQLLISNLESVWEAHEHEEENHDDAQKDGEHANDDDGDHDHDDHDHEGESHEGHDYDETEHNHDDHEGDAHDEAHTDDEANYEHHDEDKEITSLLVKFKSPLGMVQLPRFINENTEMQAALPGYEVQRLTKLLGSGVQTINGIAFAILLVSALSIFISLLKTIRERRQELALLRTYGLSTRQLLGLALREGLFLALIGFVLGWILGRLGLLGVSQYLKKVYGYGLELKGPDIFEFYLLGLTLLLTFIAALLASSSIFKLNVAKTLSDV
ncbi:MAG: FtsX-like permease family protein [Bacteroidota bacterium]